MARTKSSVMSRPFVGTGGQESGDSMEIDVDELGTVSEDEQVRPKKKEVSDEVLRARHERKKEMDRIGAKKYVISLI